MPKTEYHINSSQPVRLDAICDPLSHLQFEWIPDDNFNSKSQRILQNKIYHEASSNTFSALFLLGLLEQTITLSPSLTYWRDFAHCFTKKLTQHPDLELLRHKIHIPIEAPDIERFLDQVPLVTGAEYINEHFLKSYWKQLEIYYQNQISGHLDSVSNFFAKINPNIHLVGRIYFHLVEQKDSVQPFAFLATYSTTVDLKGKSRHLALKHALTQYQDNQQKLIDLLSTVHSAAQESPLLAEMVANGEIFHPLAWSAMEAHAFLIETPIFEKWGILCRIPNWWYNKKRVKVSVKIAGNVPSMLGFSSLVSFKPNLTLGDEIITAAEIEKYLDGNENLVMIRGQWTAMDREKLTEVMKSYKTALNLAQEGGISLGDALRMQLNPESITKSLAADQSLEICFGDWFTSMISKLQNPTLITHADPAEGFRAKLRPYQQLGLNWLAFLDSMQFGACLADDMGLGKTIQILAFLSYLKINKPGNVSLLIVPASLLANWQTEIMQFYPDLTIFMAHPQLTAKAIIDSVETAMIKKFDLVVTTYSLAISYPWIRNYPWHYIILDEAQAIKNPDSAQSRNVKKLKSQNRIILTGTPIENRLSDLWSLFDFINPGLLGNQKEFAKFNKNINQKALSKLRNVIKPYMLRRLKTDKSVISELPEKVEMKTYADLSKKQTFFYSKMVEELIALLDQSQGMQRRGIILSSLIKFKQLCNHPAQYLGDGKYLEQDSGKFLRLREICEVICDKREKALIFTQFQGITNILAEYLANIFGRQGLVLDGQVPVAKRKKIVAKFQDQEYVPFMVLSVKAGGVGLNLTQANHVIHFDRWWNPAVENQATDRVFRIGQKKNVMVHKFISRGTVEEKIDAMIEEKIRLSQEIIQESKESWITEMPDIDLINLFKLSI